jgi:hypothetical protein
MKRLLCMLPLVIAFLSVNAQSDDQIKQTLTNKYVSFLKEEGYSPTLDSDGDVKFKYESQNYYLRPTNDEKRFVLVRYLSDDDVNNFSKLVLAANATMADWYYARIYVVKKTNGEGCSVWLRIDNSLVRTDDFKTLFYKEIRILQNVVDSFKGEYNK